ncbi:alpha-glucosidase family protein [Marinomonas posidonica]|uniref:Alpha amylase catalytic region n=1 Tax=Marinomonas posidonica (strain CECT 7376 / NCIMB 14433 / IVIA-Po-181) TaxID=491952 RepID=F6CV21_MARPP|nr:alpha-glucosidase family protein [Marinomonas posidonica]AEF56441.1 alpha amylase catalytic region [Marinomonas posidonica IVIA-Po-181]
MTTNLNWWKGGIIYQIYPRSFMDANGDGVGDLVGITSKLDYVASLGVDAIWLSPIFTSPMKDFGYDVSDYCDIDPMFGSLEDFKKLINRAHDLNLKVMIDQVISHSSDVHPWFEESRQDKTNPKADWYVWADPKPDGSPPNNWLSIFGGSAWKWDSRRLQYYLHNFLESQPDMNFHHPEVRKAHLDNMRFWLELGVDGFRLDTVNFYFHSEGLEDNPPVPAGEPKTKGAPEDNPYTYQRHVYDLSRPENIDFLKELRALMDEFPGSTTVGEIGDDFPLNRMAEYTSGGDKLHMAYTFDLLNKPHSPAYIRDVLKNMQDIVGDGWPCWAVSNHDVVRARTRWGADDDGEAYPLITTALIASIRGSVCLYQGEELGLPEADVPYERIQDPYGFPLWPVFKGRDGCRTPMVWENKPQGGFSTIEPWLPVDQNHLPLSVAEQEANANSLLHKMRQFIKWRQQQPELVNGELTQVDVANGDLIAFVRDYEDQSILVVLNMTGKEQVAALSTADIELLEGHGFTCQLVGQTLTLPAYQACYARMR